MNAHDWLRSSLSIAPLFLGKACLKSLNNLLKLSVALCPILNQNLIADRCSILMSWLFSKCTRKTCFTTKFVINSLIILASSNLCRRRIICSPTISLSYQSHYLICTPRMLVYILKFVVFFFNSPIPSSFQTNLLSGLESSGCCRIASLMFLKTT